MSKFYVTAPIYYVNDKPHIGHAYTSIAADVLARYYRAKNYQVMFLTGTDEHGMKNARAAKAAHKSPQEFADEISSEFKDSWKKLNISFDAFIRTTDPAHKELVQKTLTRLKERGYIYKGKYEGLYCIGCEEYKDKTELEPGEICPIHRKKCEKISEEVYFFKLSEFTGKVKKIIESDELEIRPEIRKNEILGLLSSAPSGVAISRSKVEWGVKLPWDEAQTVYVWVDALISYLQGDWPADLHLIGKDILRFHGIIWPAMLLALEMKLPKKIFAHGYFTIDGIKMSKTLGNAIDPREIVKKYSADALRYFLLSEFPFGSDGDFSYDRLKKRYESDLANELGNLVMRVLTLTRKLRIKNEKIKMTHFAARRVNKNEKIDELIEELRFSEALTEIWKDIKAMNGEIDKIKLWELIKTDKEKSKKILESYLDRISAISSYLEPFMPETSHKIKVQLENGKPEILFPKNEAKKRGPEN
jgi:methionyl-tRNA synthetase